MRHFWKRWIAGLLTAVMLVTMLPPAFTADARAAETGEARRNAFGFDTSQSPDGFNAADGKNPYGQGKVALNPISELFVATSAAGTYQAKTYNNYSAGSAPMSGSVNTLISRSSNCNSKFVRAVAFDPTGSGKDDHIAYIGIGSDNKAEVWVLNAKTGQQSADCHLSDQAISWIGGVRQWEYFGFVAITAGDFDGDGKDELMAYDAANGTLYQVTYRNGSFSKSVFETFLGTGVSTTSKTTAPMLDLAAGDLDRDGTDDLAVAYASADGQDGVLHIKRTGEKGNDSHTFLKYNNYTTSHGVSVDIGDVNGDGWLDVVTLSHYRKPGNKVYDNSLLGCVHVSGNEGQTFTPSYSELKVLNFVEDGFYNDDPVHQPPALACVAINGIGSAEYVFAAGQVYQIDGNGSWTAKHSWDRYHHSDDGIGSCIITNTWFEDAIAGNFDGNKEGREQVVYTSAYKQKSKHDYWYSVNIMGLKSNGKWFDSFNQYVHNERSENHNLFCVLAAPDVDNDTVYLEYKSKSFTWENPRVLAILQSSPYFADLAEGYYDATGGTTFGKGVGEGSSTSSTSTVSTGFGVKAGSDFLGTVSAYVQTTFTAEWEWEFAKEQSATHTISFEGGAQENNVVVFANPVTLYEYDTYVPNNRGGYKKEAMTIAIPDELQYNMLTLDQYNEAAGAMGIAKISEEQLHAIPGKPSSYYRNNSGEWMTLQDKVTSKHSFTAVTEGNGVVTREIQTELSESSTKSYTYSMSLETGVEAFGSGISASVGGGFGKGETTFSTSSITRGGSVANLPAGTGSDYGFSWNLATWSTTVGDQKVPVVGYVLDNIKSPPSLPENFSLTESDQTSVTLGWEEGANAADSYVIYQHFVEQDRYVQVGEVFASEGEDGDFTFEINGLLPGGTYYYAVQSVGGGRESVISADITATTQREDSTLKIVQQPVAVTDVAVGDTTTFTVGANGNAALSFEWQVKEPGSRAWKTVSGGTKSTLTLRPVTAEMDGSLYRCVVSQVINGQLDTIYSQMVSLTLGKTRTSVELELSQTSGNAAYTKVEETKQEVTVPETISVTVGSSTATYTKYKNALTGGTPESIYAGEDGQYYALESLTEREGGYTANAAVLLTAAESYFATDEAGNQKYESAEPNALRGTVQETYTQEGATYNVYTAFKEVNGKLEVLTVYKKDGSYYTLKRGEDNTEILEQWTNDNSYDLEESYQENLATDTINGTVYEVLTSNGTALIYRNGGTYYYKVGQESGGAVTMAPLYVITPDTLNSGDGSTKYSAKAGDLVTTMKTVTGRKETPVDGNPVSLTATVTSSNNKRKVGGVVEFIILNNSTGSARSVSAQVGSDGKAAAAWTPTEVGVYTITASYSGSSILAPSASGGSTYYASAEETLQYVLRPGKESYTYGEQISWTLMRIDGTTESAATGVDPTYAVKYVDTNGKIVETKLEGTASYTPDKPGKYTITAKLDSQEFPATVVVSKKALAVSATDNSNAGSQKPSDKDLVFEGWVFGDESEYKGLFTVFSALQEEGSHADGEYTVTPVIVNDEEKRETVEAFQARYDYSITQGKWWLRSDTVTVTLEAGSNGTIAGKIGDSQSPAGTPVITISKGTVLRAQATPDTGWNVSHWIVTDKDGTKLTAGTDYTTDTVTVFNDTLLIHPKQDITIRVEFSNSLNKVTFSAGEGGTISATVGSQVLSSPAEVATGSSIVFTAVPNENYVVDYWTVTEGSTPVTQKYPDGSSYSANTFTLKNIGGDAAVQVWFAQKGDPLQVKFQARNKQNEPAAGAVITATETKSDGTTAVVSSGGTVTKGSRLDLTISGLTPSATVKEWMNADGTVVAGGQTTYTVYNVQAAVDLTAVITEGGKVMRTLTFSVTNEEGETVEDLQNQLTALSGSAPLTSGTGYASGTPVSFTYTETDQYEVVRWTLKEGNGAAQSVAAGRSALTYQLKDGLLHNTTVHVVVKEKPLVTVNEATNGSVHVDYTLDGVSIQPKNGYVYHGTNLTVTLTPDTGYEVDASVQASYVSESTSDAKTYTIEKVFSDQTITSEWSAIPQYTLTYSVVDTGDGGKGTLAVSSERKGMEGYAQPAISNGGRVYRDSTVTLQATPNTGHRVKEWVVDGNPLSSIATTQTLTMSKDTVVKVQFMEVGNEVTVQAGENGSITSAEAGGVDLMDNLGSGFILNKGATVTVTATPDLGYEVEHWLVNGEPVADTESKTSFQYTTAEDGVGAAITVAFRQVTYPVTWGGTNGAVTAGGQASGDRIRGGTQLTFTAVPNEGYTISGWKVNGAPQDGQTGGTFHWTVPNGMTENPAVIQYDIQAIFTRGSYAVTVTQPENGIINASHDLTQPVTGGTNVIFTAEPAEGYILSGWTVNGETVSGTGNRYPCIIEGETTISAIFVPSQYEVSFEARGEGTVSADGFSASPAKVAYGASITFTAQAEPYFFVSGWEVDGEAVSDSRDQNSFTLENVKAEHSVTAVFAPSLSFKVGYQAGEYGSLSATANGSSLTLMSNQTQNVTGGSKLVFTAAPSEGYMIDKWTVDGTAVTRENIETLGLNMDHHLSNTLIIASLQRNLRVEVSFTGYNGYTMNKDGLTGCTLADIQCMPAGKEAQPIRHGGDVTFTVKLNEGCSTISELIVNGYDCVAGKAADGLQNCESVTASKNADGSYTVTIQSVSGQPQLKATAHQLTVVKGFGSYQIPDSLKDKGIDTADKLETALKTQLTAVKDGVVFYDIALKYYDAGNSAWVEVTPSNFPVNGVDVVLDYPEGTTSTDTFTIIHMLTTGENAGKTEQVKHERKANGLHFHVTSLSPFAIGWTKYTAPVAPPPGGGGGGGIGGGGGGIGGGGIGGSTYAVTVNQAEHGKVTADPSKAAGKSTVTLTVTLDSGYVLDTLTVTDSDGNTIKLTAQGGGIYTFTMPDSKVSVDAAFVPVSTGCDGGEDCPFRIFTDLSTTAWYHEAVDYVLVNDIMGGYGGGLFGPNDPLSRAQLCQILYRWDGKPAVGLSSFTDVAPDAWYSDAVAWANANGIVSGWDGQFFPNDPITREQLAAILWRYAGSPASGHTLTGYTDVDQISSWAMDAMLWANKNNILNGDGSGHLIPKGNATRAQVAQMIKNCIKNLEERT